MQNQDFEKAAKLRDQEKEKRAELEKLRSQWETGNAGATRCVTP